MHYPFPKNNDSCSESDVLDWFIKQYEGKILRQLLGQLYYEMKDATIVDGDKWTLLLKGGEYTVGENTYTWNGLEYLIACFIYFYMTRNNEIQITTNGGKIVHYEMADNVSLKTKGITNWNNATRLIKSSRCRKRSTVQETLLHFLENNDFENYCVNFYEGGLILW